MTKGVVPACKLSLSNLNNLSKYFEKNDEIGPKICEKYNYVRFLQGQT